MSIPLLNTMRTLKPKTPEETALHTAIQKELENLAKWIPVAAPAPTASPVRVVMPGSSSGGSTATVVSDDRAGIAAITTVADQFIPYSSAISSSYVLKVWFLDNLGGSGEIGVLQTDWLGNGFWLRSGLIPISPPTTTTGMLFYSATKAV